MCRNIRTLYNFEPPVTVAEIDAAALQYVRKVTGMRKPSSANEEAFDRAVQEIAEVTRRLLTQELRTTAEPKDREAENERARERGRKRDERMRLRVLAELEGGG